MQVYLVQQRKSPCYCDLLRMRRLSSNAKKRSGHCAITLCLESGKTPPTNEEVTSNASKSPPSSLPPSPPPPTTQEHNVDSLGSGRILSAVKKESDSEESDNIHDNKRMTQEEVRTDLEIIARNNQPVKCHSGLLSAQSEVFKRMIETNEETEGSKTKRIFMNDLNEKALKALLAYLYYRDLKDVKRCSLVAVELLKAGHKYQIRNLEPAVKGILLNKPNEWFHADAAFSLFQFAGALEHHEDLKRKAATVLKSKSAELEELSKYSKNGLIKAEAEESNY